MEDLLQSAYRYGFSLSHDHHQAQDMVQEACRRLMESGRKINKPLLMRTVRNIFIDQYRRMRLISFESLDHQADRLEAAEASLNRIADQLDIRAALAALKPEERELIYLQSVEGWSAAEISDFTGRPRGTVLSLIFRGKKKMQEFARQTMSDRDVSHES